MELKRFFLINPGSKQDSKLKLRAGSRYAVTDLNGNIYTGELVYEDPTRIELVVTHCQRIDGAISALKFKNPLEIPLDALKSVRRVNRSASQT